MLMTYYCIYMYILQQEASELSLLPSSSVLEQMWFPEKYNTDKHISWKRDNFTFIGSKKYSSCFPEILREKDSHT